MGRIVNVVKKCGALLVLVDDPPRLVLEGEVVAAQVGAEAAPHQPLRGEHHCPADGKYVSVRVQRL